MPMLRIILFLMKGGAQMVDLYLALITAGRRTFSQIPVKYQAAVRADLLALGLDENGNQI